MRKLITYSCIFLLASLVNICAQEDYEIAPMPFSAKMYNEYAPVYYKGGLVFCSDRNEVGLTQFTTIKNQGIVNLYYSIPKGEKWDDPIIFARKLKTNWHEGPLSISADETKLFYTRNINASKKLKGNKKVKDRLGIFEAHFDGKDWEEVGPFEYNSEDYSIMHPSLSPDGKTLFFACDKKGGKGQFDIYVSYYKNGKWTEPENLGINVNSKNDDVFPYYHSSGRLYFSSKGHPGYGRLDVFYTEKIEGQWVKIKHLPAPINSQRDDFGLIINEMFDEGYVSSNRKRKNDDIYRFYITMPKFDECPLMEINDYCYTFFETGSMDIDSTSLKYEWDLGDGKKVRDLEAKHCYKEKGTYMIQLNIIDTLTGDVLMNEASMLFEVDDKKQMVITSQDTVFAGQEIKFDSKSSYLDESIDKYYWDFGDGYMLNTPNTNYVFNKHGEYLVKLGAKAVKNAEGESRKYCNSKKVIVLKNKR